jgi:UTP--glucose-1-phosphate uridylyltransferase
MPANHPTPNTQHPTPIKVCLFPVAGYGTRFLPATKAIPKEMLPILAKPLIQYGVEEAYSAGIRTMAMVMNKHKKAIEDHFDTHTDIEASIRGSAKEALLVNTNSLIEQCTFIYTRQLEMKGLGHAILTGEPLIGNKPFAVILPDDLCYHDSDPVLKQMTDLYAQYPDHCIVAVEEVPRDQTDKYGIVETTPLPTATHSTFNIHHPTLITSMVENPNPSEAPSNLAVIGRYILTPDIFDVLEHTPPGKGGEIQITDALMELARQGKVLAYRFRGRRFDCGNVDGFVEATNYFYTKRDG